MIPRGGGFAALCCALGAACGPRPDSAHAGVRIEEAFPHWPRLERPLWFGALPGNTALHAVAEQGGRILVFDLDETGRAGELELFLDLSERVSRVGNEEGLLGLAFHPDHGSNGRLFVHYSLAGARRNRISEFKRLRAEGPLEAWERRVDPQHERVLLEVEQPFRNHNGGHLLFDPAGMLWIGLGDGGGAGDPERTAQDPSSLLGSILRIDVDRSADGRPYSIPEDNPFLSSAGARPELWAIGLRNPWRFDLDPATGLLWVADVGQVREEEVSALAAGANAGWPLREGRSDFDPAARRGPGTWTEPLWTYGREFGVSITGGVVLRPGTLPTLRERYVCADYGSGRLWALPLAGAAGASGVIELGRLPSPSHFGLDVWGNLHATSFDGRVYRFVEP